MRFFFILIMYSLLGQSFFAQKTVVQISEKQKIEHLIKSLENLEGAKFWRNGEYHTAKEAADHLRMKWENAGNKIKTAKQFIDTIATKSSMSGKVYKIKFKDGKEVESKVFLYQKLNELK